MKFREFYLTEKTKVTSPYVVVYSGRFQPFHKGHFETYQNLVKEFGSNNVFIGTSDKVETPKSPFNFNEKKKIMTKMFPIPANKIVKVKNPYNPTEVLDRFDENKVAYIAVVGDKDGERLSPKYFTPLTPEMRELKPYSETTYLYVAPPNTTKYNGKQVSGTMVREILGGGDEGEKEGLFRSLYPKFDRKIFELITSKIGG